MIGQLRGLLIAKHPPDLMIDVQGVGYELQAPLSTFYLLPELQQEIILYTHLSIREDAHILYGFMTLGERHLFRSLIRVNGVGPKLALSILSAMDAQEFLRCVQQNDSTGLIRIPGVGKKTAERLIVEMRDRLDTSLSSDPQRIADFSSAPINKGVTRPQDDAISALIALGYKPQDATHWVNAIYDPTATSEDLIRRALKAAL
ncbi:Holliday junction branch migration protein RuvA [Thioflexithrix psekupsensis]|uniref:Holliday junction branch migration complex subunit RuvA n=1 Tax=Thioflexithrix psekupsensis TaxID=1570016 RepID=A0A251X425_9GAMM|nr:Holliday junction branch migration protein RuvA [Thioflexithrix psekupsensis]OUD12140.1 Holliday junction DNA helicase RuvA [Thioflexithrix psekupsensis]